MSKIEPPVKLMMRLPPDLHAQLVNAASETERSMNGFIIHCIKAELKRSEYLDQIVEQQHRSEDDGR